MPKTLELTPLLGLKLDVDLVGKQSNVPGTLLTSLDYVTLHDTANVNRGANADMHRKFVAAGGGADGVSFTYTVDDKHAIQILVENWDNWAQGNKTGNDRSCSIELCVNADADPVKARDNAAKLVACILVANNLGIDRLKQHNYWSGKNCPASIRKEPGAWERFVAAVERYVAQLRALLAPKPAPEQTLVLNGHQVDGAFRVFWQDHGGLDIFGLPISNLEAMRFEGLGELTVQWFERARFELHDKQVQLGRVGAEAMGAKR